MSGSWERARKPRVIGVRGGCMTCKNMALTWSIRVLSQVCSDDKAGDHSGGVSHHQNDLRDGKCKVGFSAAIAHFSLEQR